MNDNDRAEALREMRLFKVGSSFLFAVQIPDDSVGCSGSRCSNCNNTVAYCEQRCTSCGFPFIGPSGFPQFSKWKTLDSSRKRILVEDVYASGVSRGRLGYSNVEFVPLTVRELSRVERLEGCDARHFISAHLISPKVIRVTLFE